MPPKKTSKAVKSGSRAEDAFLDGLTSPPASETVLSPSINISAYPHLLSLILDYSSSSTLTTLLRCSKGMLITVAPLIYKDLRITSLQLAELLEIGWAPSKPGSSSGLSWTSFSPFATACLLCVRTLHLLNYHRDVEYPESPPRLLPNNKIIILYPTGLEKDSTYVRLGHLEMRLPPLFASLGGPDLYIRLSGSDVRTPVAQVCECHIQDLPEQITTVTLLIPEARHLVKSPSLGFAEGSHGDACNAVVVLLPWQDEGDEKAEDLQGSMHKRWTAARLEDPTATQSEHKRKFIGFEYADVGADHATLVAAPAPDSGTTPASFARFGPWLEALWPGTVFEEEESRSLGWADICALQRINTVQLKELAKILDQLCADGYDVNSFTMIDLRKRISNAQEIQDFTEGLLQDEARLMASRLAAGKGDSEE